MSTVLTNLLIKILIILFIGASFIGILFTFFVIPETKGKSMTDIQRMLSGEKNIQD